MMINNLIPRLSRFFFVFLFLFIFRYPLRQVIQHSEVDVFQAVKTVRRHRPQLVENMVKHKRFFSLLPLITLIHFNSISRRA